MDPNEKLRMQDKHRLCEIAGEMERSVQALKEVGCDDAELIDGNARIAADLRAIAGRIAEPAPSPSPPPAAVDDPTKNVCAIRRRSDGYWWECNSEHGAGWNDKRIRQAWTHRSARVEVARMKATGVVTDDVEVVELAPRPVGEDDPKKVAALALEAVKRDITTSFREKYSNPNLPAIYCDNNGNGWRINYDEMHTLLSCRIKQALSGTWFWPQSVEPVAVDAPGDECPYQGEVWAPEHIARGEFNPRVPCGQLGQLCPRCVADAQRALAKEPKP